MATGTIGGEPCCRCPLTPLAPVGEPLLILFRPSLLAPAEAPPVVEPLGVFRPFPGLALPPLSLNGIEQGGADAVAWPACPREFGGVVSKRSQPALGKYRMGQAC